MISLLLLGIPGRDNCLRLLKKVETLVGNPKKKTTCMEKLWYVAIWYISSFGQDRYFANYFLGGLISWS